MAQDMIEQAEDVSTHSRPEAAGTGNSTWLPLQDMFQLTAARRRLDPLQAEPGGLQKFQLTAARRRLGLVSLLIFNLLLVSTHSRPEAAGWCWTSLLAASKAFQLTAARRRLEN